MEYANHLNEYTAAPTTSEVAQAVEAAQKAVKANMNVDVWKFCLSAIDLTSLSCSDNEESIREFARRAAAFGPQYPHLNNVASICVAQYINRVSDVAYSVSKKVHYLGWEMLLSSFSVKVLLVIVKSAEAVSKKSCRVI